MNGIQFLLKFLHDFLRPSRQSEEIPEAPANERIKPQQLLITVY